MGFHVLRKWIIPTHVPGDSECSGGLRWSYKDMWEGRMGLQQGHGEASVAPPPHPTVDPPNALSYSCTTVFRFPPTRLLLRSGPPHLFPQFLQEFPNPFLHLQTSPHLLPPPG